MQNTLPTLCKVEDLLAVSIRLMPMVAEGADVVEIMEAVEEVEVVVVEEGMGKETMIIIIPTNILSGCRMEKQSMSTHPSTWIHRRTPNYLRKQGGDC